MPSTLKLTVKRLPFEVMATFEKMVEFRKPSEWIKSRLYHKDGTERDYDFIEFSNGYGANVPKFRAAFCGFEICETDRTETYSNGLQVIVQKGDFMIGFLKQEEFDELMKVISETK